MVVDILQFAGELELGVEGSRAAGEHDDNHVRTTGRPSVLRHLESLELTGGCS